MVRKTNNVRRKREVKIDYSDEENDITEYVYDEITGGRMKKPVMSVLNKTKLSKYEMDDLLNSLE